MKRNYSIFKRAKSAKRFATGMLLENDLILESINLLLTQAMKGTSIPFVHSFAHLHAVGPPCASKDLTPGVVNAAVPPKPFGTGGGFKMCHSTIFKKSL